MRTRRLFGTFASLFLFLLALYVEPGRAAGDSAVITAAREGDVAALQGAPVTTVDFDFMFRKTPVNARELKELARRLGAVVLRPYYPISDLFRVVRGDDGLHLDFMAT